MIPIFNCLAFLMAAQVGAVAESGAGFFYESAALPAVTSRLTVGGETLPIDFPFGILDISPRLHYCKSAKCTPPSSEPLQTWMLPIHTAQGLFSVGLNAVALGDCGED